MKKSMSISKVLALILTASTLSISGPAQTVQASTINNNKSTKININSSYKTGIIYEDKDFKVIQTENQRTVLDKKTLKTTVLTFSNSAHTKGTYKDIDGTIKKYSTDYNGNVYLDGSCIMKVQQSIDVVKSKSSLVGYYGYTNKRSFVGKDGYRYYYVNRTTYNTTTTGNIVSIAMGILSFMPYVGSIFGIASIIETARNLNATTLYVVEDQYCTSDYSHYAYKNFFYSDSRHKHLIKSTTTYKRMF